MTDMINFMQRMIHSYNNDHTQILDTTKEPSAHQLADAIKDTGHFFDCSDLYEYAVSEVSQHYPEVDTPPSVDARMPGNIVCLYYNNEMKTPIEGKDPSDWPVKRTEGCAVLVSGEKPEHWSCFTLTNPDDHYPHPCGGIVDNEFRVYESYSNLSADKKKIDNFQLRLAATILSLINSPRYVKTEPLNISRQIKRAMQRGMGFAVNAWHRISWDIDKPVTAKEPFDRNYHKQALHFRRGHWKSAEPKHPKSIRRKDRKWYTWIEGYFAGHPSFGIKLTYYQPKKSGIMQ